MSSGPEKHGSPHTQPTEQATRLWTPDNLQRLEPQTKLSAEISGFLKGHVFGQDDAVDIFARRAAVIQEGLHDRKRPAGVVHALGPSGVGKTELARALAAYFFGDPKSDRLKIIDMGEFQESHTTAKFIGSPPGYVGNEEVGVISHEWLHASVPNPRSPHLTSIILLDEISSAHESITKMLMNIYDTGRATSRNGKQGFQELDFRKALIYSTSNDGVEEMDDHLKRGGRPVGFGIASQNVSQIGDIGIDAFKESHKPQFVNRYTDILAFKDLGPEQYDAIFDKKVRERNESMQEGSEKGAPYFIMFPNIKEHILQNLDTNRRGRSIGPLLDQEVFSKAVDVIKQVPPYHPLFVDFDREKREVVFLKDNNLPVVEQISEKGEQENDYLREMGLEPEIMERIWDLKERGIGRMIEMDLSSEGDGSDAEEAGIIIPWEEKEVGKDLHVVMLGNGDTFIVSPRNDKEDTLRNYQSNFFSNPKPFVIRECPTPENIARKFILTPHFFNATVHYSSRNPEQLSFLEKAIPEAVEYAIQNREKDDKGRQKAGEIFTGAVIDKLSN